MRAACAHALLHNCCEVNFQSPTLWPILLRAFHIHIHTHTYNLLVETLPSQKLASVPEEKDVLFARMYYYLAASTQLLKQFASQTFYTLLPLRMYIYIYKIYHICTYMYVYMYVYPLLTIS